MNATLATTRDLAFTDARGNTRKFPAGSAVHVVTYRNKPGYELRVRGTLHVRRVRDLATYAA